MSVEKSDKSSHIASKPLRILSEYENVMSKVLRLIASETSFESTPPLREVVEENERVIIVFSHSAPLSWIPAPCLLAYELVQAGGGNRTPISIVDRFFFAMPGLRKLAHYITQSHRPLSFNELLDHFVSLKTADLVLFPEGSNCFFGPSDRLQDFRSNRFVEIAIRTNTPLLLCVHRGSEAWAKSIEVSDELLDRVPKPLQKFIGRRLRASGMLTIPLPPRPMKQYSMRCELHVCESEDIARESGLVAEKMRTMLARLDSDLEEAAL